MSPPSFARAKSASKEIERRRCETFLGERKCVPALPPLTRSIEVVKPLFSTSGWVGRRQMGVPEKLRMHPLHTRPQPDGSIEEATKDAMHCGRAWRDPVGIGALRERLQADTTHPRRSRPLLAAALAKATFEVNDRHLHQQGMLEGGRTILDADITATSRPTQTGTCKNPPRRARPGGAIQVHRGMKACIGVHAASKLFHGSVGGVANIAGVTRAIATPHRKQTGAVGVAVSRGVFRSEGAHRSVRHVAMRCGERRLTSSSAMRRMREKVAATRACIEGRGRALVPHHRAAVPPQGQALPKAGQELPAAVQPMRAGQSGHD